MKKYKRIFCTIIVTILLLGAVPAYAASSNGLNGSSCLDADFDESIYDVSVSYEDVRDGKFAWPSSGTILVTGCPTNASTFNAKLNKITIPDGLVVDFYTGRYKPAGATEWTRTCMAHIDTTGSSTSSNNTGNTGTTTSPGNSNSSGNTNTSSKDWGTVKKVFVPGTPASSYSKTYTDVAENAWYYHAVMTLTEGGLLAGYGNGKFGPNDALTKGQVSIIFTRLLGNEIVGNGSSYAPYNDSTTSSRAFAAIWYAGRLNSTGGTVSLTQYETSLVKDAGGMLSNLSKDGRIGTMWRAIYDNWRAGLDAGKNINYISSVDDLPDAADIHKWIEENYVQMGQILHITSGDKAEIIDYCEDAIMRAYNLGMISGVDSKGTFAPYAALTRGQMAQILYNVGWTYTGCLSYSGL